MGTPPVIVAWVCSSLMLLSALAGCVTSDAGIESERQESPGVDPNLPEEIPEQPAHVTGTVVDPELVPIAEVDVVVRPGDLTTYTDAAGSFSLGPLDAGKYTVFAEKRGYQGASAEVEVFEDRPTKVTLILTPVASDVPYHETSTRTMFLYCSLSIRVGTDPTGYFTILTAPCVGLVEILLQTATGQSAANTLDTWTFDFKIEKPGFASLVMEMIWPPQQLGTNGILQLTEFATAQTSGTGVTVGKTVYGDSQAQPFHAVIHAGESYWVSRGQNVTFYPTPNETVDFQMLVAGGFGNNTVPLGESAVFINWRPTVYLTFFHNRRAASDFSILPDQ